MPDGRSAAAPSPVLQKVKSTTSVFVSRVGGAIVDLVAVDSGGQTLICAAEDRNVHVLSQGGEKYSGSMPTDGPIRLLHWWGEHNLLLAGCEDEKVIAFEPDSGVTERWVFVVGGRPRRVQGR